jgi:hypothetical protein
VQDLSANIFISFASQDRKVATTLCAALESRGFSCWISSRDIAPGDNFQSAIVRAIRNAKMMLLVFTANSNASDEMSKELALASQQKLIVVPLRVEDVAPNEAFAYEFATRQWIDFFADWEAAINQLCVRLAQAMPPEAPAAPLAVEPPPVAEPPAPAPVAEARPTPAAKAPVAEPPKPDPKPQAAPEAKAAPEPKPAPPPAPEIKRAAEAKPASAPKPAPAAAKPSPAPDAAPAQGKSRAGLFIGVGVAAVLVIGIVVAAPMLTGKKTAAQASIAPSASPMVSASAPSAAPAAPSEAPAATAAAASVASASAAPADASAASAAPAATPKPRVHKTHTAQAAAKADVPY